MQSIKWSKTGNLLVFVQLSNMTFNKTHIIIDKKFDKSALFSIYNNKFEYFCSDNKHCYQCPACNSSCRYEEVGFTCSILVYVHMSIFNKYQ